jgi:hypothetical protein
MERYIRRVLRLRGSHLSRFKLYYEELPETRN